MKLKIKSKKGLLGIIIIAIILGIMLAVCLINNKISKSDETLIEYLKQVLILKEDEIISDVKENETISISKDVVVVPTMQDKISSNSMWCPTFQLVWNDMVNEVVKKDVIFEPQLEMVENLNKQEFKAEMLNENSYYKIYGLKTLDLKAKIEKGIKDKFNETSDILDKLNWEEEALHQEGTETKRYLFYTMIKKKFEFENEFSILEASSFGNEMNSVNYFGVNSSSLDKVRNQVKVWYYNSDEEFAVELLTKQGDSVILVRGENTNTFQKIYENAKTKENKYLGNKNLEEIDRVKVPNINVDVLKEYEELKHKGFTNTENEYCEIEEAIQTIKFELDHTGGEVKSEAVIEMLTESIAISEEKTKPRYFHFDDTFTMFLREKNAELPYLAVRISDIDLYK